MSPWIGTSVFFAALVGSVAQALLDTFGDEYARHMQRTKRIIPEIS